MQETCIQVAYTTIQVSHRRNTTADGDDNLATKYCKRKQHGPLTNSNAALQSRDCKFLVQNRTAVAAGGEGRVGAVIFLAFLGTQNAPKSLAAGAKPQTALGSLQHSPDT